MSARIPHALLVVLGALTLGSCAGVRTLADPTLEIRTAGGKELGVSTDYGIVFLGRTARAGNIEITAFFGDGPNVEKTVIEPISNGLYTAETEIVFPSVSMSFDEPKPGTELLVIGRDKKGPWKAKVLVQSDRRVSGILVTIPPELADAPDQVGAGVYVLPNGDEKQKRLVGLVSARMRLRTADGKRDYLTVVGPTDLWRLVSHRHDHPSKRHWVYREDIL